MKINNIEPIFVELMPNEIEEGKLYISKEYNVAIHKCACGCGEQTVTTLDKDLGWLLTENNNKVSLTPSIGNFNFKCKSHYFIRDNMIVWL